MNEKNQLIQRKLNYDTQANLTSKFMKCHLNVPRDLKNNCKQKLLDTSLKTHDHLGYQDFAKIERITGKKRKEKKS